MSCSCTQTKHLEKCHFLGPQTHKYMVVLITGRLYDVISFFSVKFDRIHIFFLTCLVSDPSRKLAPSDLLTFEHFYRQLKAFSLCGLAP